MFIVGCACCCISDCGALGFSKEKSLLYCATTRNWAWPCVCPCGGGGAAGVSPPLVWVAICVDLRSRRLDVLDLTGLSRSGACAVGCLRGSTPWTAVWLTHAPLTDKDQPARRSG